MSTFADRLRALLPDLYPLNDETGDLAILLQVVGPTFDALQATITALPTLAGVDTCPTEFLPHLAALVGVVYDPLGDPLLQRRTIREAVERYRRHGTLVALRRALEEAGWQGEIIETYRQVLRLNRRGRLNQQRLPGPQYNHGVFLVECATLLNGLESIIEDHQPAGTRCWLRQGHLMVSTGCYVPSGVSALQVCRGTTSRYWRRFTVQVSTLNGGDPLVWPRADESQITVL